jgi:hypothetical protein
MDLEISQGEDFNRTNHSFLIKRQLRLNLYINIFPVDEYCIINSCTLQIVKKKPMIVTKLKGSPGTNSKKFETN